ncbi:RICIN domain-containing protein [Tautonia rosea]|uniref:hypothetical protein n=1 Tax=Tautonia rosea TaxID=2728037 RepID=UPI0014733F82|nr:hypothetical protein [Tautonia rosea]
MSQTQGDPAIDLIRWTFTADAARRNEIESYLNDLGLDVFSRGDGQFIVLWDEPDVDHDEVVERLWTINGEAFEVTHESFRRLDLLVYQAEEDDSDAEAA